MKQRYLLPIFAVLFTAAVSFGINAFASTFTEPSGSPTSYNAPAPLDTSANANTKVGGLLLNSGGATNGLIVQSGNVGIGTASPGSKLTVTGTIESTSGGIKFPDATVQTTAAAPTTATPGTLCGLVISGNGSAHITCNGYDPIASCPSGYTQLSCPFLRDEVHVYTFYTCSKN